MSALSFGRGKHGKFFAPELQMSNLSVNDNGLISLKKKKKSNVLKKEALVVTKKACKMPMMKSAS